MPPQPQQPGSTRNSDPNPNPVPIAAGSPQPQVGSTHSGDSATGFARNRSTAPVPAGLGLREGESKWVLGGIGFGFVGRKNWYILGKNGNKGNDDDGYKNSKIGKSDHKVEIGMNHGIGAVVLLVVVDDIAGTVGHLVEGTKNNPFLRCNGLVPMIIKYVYLLGLDLSSSRREKLEESRGEEGYSAINININTYMRNVGMYSVLLFGPD
ncbi:hypothetical protein PanWU01x14_147490 [Parasponia andersonii]|uniref:Uncharacterized protein n=1 Tax=Parasponia andersonii TaxID=3476 RepID=A0A2P5CJE1_PARAD|nr:hypothetical protein PanWU01x14_147490 [Parasponia andersonii]